MESYVDLKPLPPHQWDVSLQHIIVDMQGSPLNVHQLLAHQPDLLRTWWNSRQYLVSGASLSKRQAELVILRVAVQMKCWYEWGAHVVRGLQAGLSKDEIMKVIDGPESNTWNQSDRLLLKVVDDLFVHRKIRSNTLSELTECFTAHQVLDLIALASMYQFLGHVLNTWPTELESNIQNVLPASFTKDNFDLHSNTAPSEHQHRLEPVTKNMDVEEISHLRMQWLMSKNHQSIKKHLHPDLHYVHSSGVKQNCTAYEDYLASGPTYLYASQSILDIQKRGDVAIITADLDLELCYSTGEIKPVRAFSFEVWSRQHGVWLLKICQSTAKPELD